MGLPACQPEPLETALRVKVRELFGDSAHVQPTLTFEGESLLEIHTTLGVDAAASRMDQVFDWLIDQYPYDDTVVGLRHVHQCSEAAVEFDVSESSDLTATEDDLMCNFYPNDTGLQGLIVNAMARGGMKHEPRLKVTVSEGTRGAASPFDAVVTISPTPFLKEGYLSLADERRVIAFISANLDVLMGIWDESIRCTQAPQLFRRTE